MHSVPQFVCVRCACTEKQASFLCIRVDACVFPSCLCTQCLGGPDGIWMKPGCVPDVCSHVWVYLVGVHPVCVPGGCAPCVWVYLLGVYPVCGCTCWVCTWCVGVPCGCVPYEWVYLVGVWVHLLGVYPVCGCTWWVCTLCVGVPGGCVPSLNGCTWWVCTLCVGVPGGCVPCVWVYLVGVLGAAVLSTRDELRTVVLRHVHDRQRVLVERETHL